MSRIDIKTKDGAKLFKGCAESDPSWGVDYLVKTIGKWDKNELLNFKEGRRDIIWALESILVWKEHFQDGARILLSLAEAENESWGNNATGIFVELFSFSTGPAATTAASPKERLPILEEALNSDSKEKRIVGIKACSHALKTSGHIRHVGAEFHSIKRAPDLWVPKTYKELFDIYEFVWKLLYKQLFVTNGDERELILDVILNRMGEIGRIKALSSLVVSSLEGIVTIQDINKLKILERIIDVLGFHTKELSNDTKAAMQKIRDELTGTDYDSLLRRFVGIARHRDIVVQEGKIKNLNEEGIEKLAAEAVDNNTKLFSNLAWLSSNEAKNNYLFGYYISKNDHSHSLLDKIIKEHFRDQERGNNLLVCGYLRNIYEVNTGLWEKILARLINDDIKASDILDLTCRSGMTDDAAINILNLFKKDKFTNEDFINSNFTLQAQEISEEIFYQWIEFLLIKNNSSVTSSAIDWCTFYYLHRNTSKKMPKELIYRLLTSESLLAPKTDKEYQRLDDYRWAEIANHFINNNKKIALEIANFIVDHIGLEGTIFDGFRSEIYGVLTKIGKINAIGLWDIIKKHLDSPYSIAQFHLKSWLGGREYFGENETGSLDLFPPEVVYDWVNENIEKRAGFLASLIPKSIRTQENEYNWVIEVLKRYGDREDVRRNLTANFYTEGWTGPARLHYEKRKQNLIDFKKTQDDANVMNWIDEYLDTIESDIKRSRIHEERDED